jgi:transcription elongation factor Elf1
MPFYSIEGFSYTHMTPKDVRCPLCQRRFLSGDASLKRHLRITHGIDISGRDMSFISRLVGGLPAETVTLPKLDISRRRAQFVSEWGTCDVCYQQSTRRWLYKNSTRGEVILCVNCQDKLKKKKTKKGFDLLDSYSRLPGCYGAAKK